jgi:hypothetical protein
MSLGLPTVILLTFKHTAIALPKQSPFTGSPLSIMDRGLFLGYAEMAIALCYRESSP